MAKAWRSGQQPNSRQIERIYKSYTQAMGGVSNASNYLHEALAHVFIVVAKISPKIGLAIWYSMDNDRPQRKALRAAVKAAPAAIWQKYPKAKDDILWLLTETDALANLRNDAVHAPCSISVSVKGVQMQPSIGAYIYGHPRAKNLWGKDIIAQFSLYERKMGTLCIYARKVGEILARDGTAPWPDKPSLQAPAQTPKKPSRASRPTPPK